MPSAATPALRLVRSKACDAGSRAADCAWANDIAFNQLPRHFAHRRANAFAGYKDALAGHGIALNEALVGRALDAGNRAAGGESLPARLPTALVASASTTWPMGDEAAHQRAFECRIGLGGGFDGILLRR